MKSILKAFAVAVTLIALAACNHKAEFTTDSFVRFDVTSLSFDEDAGSATLAVKVYPRDGFPDTHVYFEWAPATDGNRNSVQAEYGTDYTVSPSAGVLDFYNDSTQYITIYPVQYEEVVTGDRCFTVTLTGADNGYSLTAYNEVLVKIKDLESNENWVSLGMCKYTEDFMTTFYSVDNVTYEVEIEEEENTPGWFRLVYPYDGKYPYNDDWTTAPGYYEEGEADWDLENIHYMEIHTEDPEGVYISYHDSGMDWGYGNILMWSMADYYYEEGGYSREEIKEAGWCGTYKNGIITFPTDALLISMPGYISGWYYANYYGAFKVVMPGTVQGDFTVSIDYAGKFTSVDDENYAVATVDFEGKDIAYAHVAMAEGRDYEALIDSLKVGNIDCVEITESGSVAFPCEESGNYTIAVVSYSSDDEVGDTDYVTFRFETVVETWSLYGTGNYEYSGIVFEDDDPGLEIYHSNTSSTRFKIEHWGNDVDFIFEWDQDANEIYVEDQYTGYTYAYYNDPINIRDLSDDTDWNWFLNYIPTGYYEDGTFYFAITYYGESTGDWGIGYETFTLEDYNGGPAVGDVYGTFYTYEYSIANSGLYGSYYVIEESDNQAKGNIMFTMFDYFDCDQGSVYGTYDEASGVAEFDNDQIFSTSSGYYVGARLYYYYSYYPIAFMFFKNGDFWGPMYGDYLDVGGYTYSSGGGRPGQSSGYTYQGYFDVYNFLYSGNLGADPNSVKPAGVKERPEASELMNKSFRKTVDFKPITADKNASASRYNFVPTKEVKARVIDKTQRRTDIQQVSPEMK